MSTRAEEIAGEGPYTVRYDNGRYVLDGPTPTVGFWALEEWDAQNHADDLNAAYKQGQQDRWISAKDRLPKEGERVLATDGDTVGEVLYVHYGANTRTALAFRRTTTGPVLDDVTHWQLLPTPPNPEQR